MERIYTKGAVLKAMAREQLIGKYGAAVMTELTYSLIGFAAAFICSNVVQPTDTMGILIYSAVSILLGLLMSIFDLGLCCFYLNLISGRKAVPSDLFTGFKGYGDKVIAVKFFIMISALAGCLPAAAAAFWYYTSPSVNSMALLGVMSVAGIILMLHVLIGFSQVLYIMLDFPELKVSDVMVRSTMIMHGKRLKFLGLMISFVPYCVLGFLSAGIAFCWIVPYINATLAEFYLDIA